MPKSCDSQKCNVSCDDGIEVKKKLLNLARTGGTFAATYDIVIINKTCDNLCNLSVIDSFSGFKHRDENNTEIFLEYSNAEAQCDDECIKVLPIEQIVANKGQLVDVCKSTVPARSICRIVLRIVGEPIVLLSTATDGETRPRFDLLLCNSVVVKGCLASKAKCGCCYSNKRPIMPIYASSGTHRSRTIIDED